MTAPLAPAPASEALLARAQAVTPGGVNSPVRAFRAVGGTPRFMVSGRGPVPRRRRRPRVRRPGLLVGAAAARPRAPGGRRRRAGRGRARHVVRHADRGRGRARRGDRGPGRAGRAGAAGLQRHRGDDVGDPAGPRLHRPRQGREVRRLLPRPRRLAARRGRVGRRDPRPARHARRHGCLGRGHRRRAVQRPGRRRGRLRDVRRGRSPRHHRGGRRQHGRRPAGAGLQRRAGRAVPGQRRAVRQRRGDDRLPRLAGRLVRARGRAAGPDDVRQGDGRRLPGRGLRRPRRRDGAAGAGRAGLPGRDPVREPGRDRRRAGHPARLPTTTSTRGSTRSPPSCRRWSATR